MLTTLVFPATAFLVFICKLLNEKIKEGRDILPLGSLSQPQNRARHGLSVRALLPSRSDCLDVTLFRKIVWT